MARNSIKIPEDVKEFAKLTLKKFRKENKYAYDSKKEMKQGFYEELMYKFAPTVNFTLRFGHIKDDDVKEVINEIFKKYAEEDFLKYIVKGLKNETFDSEIEDALRLMPVILSDMLREIEIQNKALAAEGKDELYDTEYIVDTIKKLMKVNKKFKKLQKKGIAENVAVDILCVIPHKDIFEQKNGSASYRMKQFVNTIYDLASTNDIKFGVIVNEIIPEEWIDTLVLYVLLEKKDRYGRMNDNQKKVYSDITAWALGMLEKSENDTIRKIISSYIAGRKRDESNDAPRRFPLNQLSEADYPSISKVIKKLQAEDATVEKYLG